MFNEQLKLHIIVFVWGFTAILGVLIELDSFQLVFYRTLIAAISMGIFMKFKGWDLKVNWKEAFKLLFTGGLVASHWILFFASAKISKVSVCLAGIATTALFTSLLEPLLTKSSIKPYEVVLGLFVIVGLYIIFQFEFDHALGLSLSLCAAFVGSLFSVLNGNYVKTISSPKITLYEMIGGCITAFICLPFLSDSPTLLAVPSTLDIIYLLILAVICTTIAYAVCVEIQKSLSAFQVNLTVNLEPIYGIILALLFFGEEETMTPGFYVGAGIILLSVLSYPFLKQNYNRRSSNRKKLHEEVIQN
ncbi:DMT family transporter [Flammeovirga aprica]|uniref:DMT family transporter n=1 Tax=Flammeovirga aprica JL-4 TaxID=694437 RepID=A0A7X9P0S7_9BACT|nr:DMT family transporter [Flammeovirga aprica]NME67123.1 DMT family transporter [Flammeovirga aprica JL-4]